MIQQYHDYEGDGMDPGLGELAYDGTEYEVGLDDFGERIGTDDMADELTEDELLDEPADSATDATEGAAATDTRVEEGFGETISPEANPHLGDQLEDERLGREAEADYAPAEQEQAED